MIDSFLKDTIREFISNQLGTNISHLEFATVGGGSINQAYKVSLNNGTKFFCKINSADLFPAMFEKEKRGLDLLAVSGIKVPQVIGTCI